MEDRIIKARRGKRAYPKPMGDLSLLEIPMENVGVVGRLGILEETTWKK
jgi:hypothetical protein